MKAHSGAGRNAKIGGRKLCMSPSAGITRIRFSGRRQTPSQPLTFRLPGYIVTSVTPGFPAHNSYRLDTASNPSTVVAAVMPPENASTIASASGISTTETNSVGSGRGPARSRTALHPNR